MPVIACLGWGSLIWDSRELPVQRKWYEDGPLIRVEFARQSNDGRITLVLVDDEDIPRIRALWAIMDTADIAKAKEALRLREGSIRSEHIGAWCLGDDPPIKIPALPNWSQANGLDAVIWTSLPPKFGDQERMPSAAEVVSYLSNLRGTVRDAAERYIRSTPRQVDTPYRRQIEAEFAWNCIA